jgi:surface polysaccharide O-acyltransferase-like enzyme
MSRVFWIDLIRVVAPILVVMQHVSGRIAGGYETHGETVAWLTCQFYRQLGACAVPLFIMISGALLLGRNETIATFYQKRFGKILLPFFVWSFIYILCRWLNGQTLEDGTPITIASSIGAVLSMNSNGHFWFMYAIIALYLVAPFLSVFVRNAPKNMLTSFLILWFVAAAIFPVVNDIAKTTLGITNIYFRFEFVSLWLGFFVAGYFFKDFLLSKRQVVIAIVVWLCLAMTVPINAYMKSVFADSSMFFLFDFMEKYILSIVSHRITVSVILFLIIRSLGDLSLLSSSWFARRMVPVLVPLSFGIYLSHYLFVIPIMKKLSLFQCESWGIVLCVVPAVTILVYLVSAAFVYLIRRVRFLRNILAP